MMAMPERDDISQERLERLADSPLVELILTCEDLADAADVIAGNEYMWDRVVRDVARECSAISSEDTADEVCTVFLQQIGRYARLGKGPTQEQEQAQE